MSTTVSGSIGLDHYRTTLHIGEHTLYADEPVSNGGRDHGPTPSQMVLSALAACKLITTRMYADRKEWPVGSITVELEMNVDYAARPLANTQIRCRLFAEGELSAAQRKRLVTIADKCPTHRLISGDVAIQSEWRGE